MIVFQEIVDVARFSKKVIPQNYQCQSYENKGTKHQHVVLCHKNRFRFVMAPGEDNFALEAAALNSRARPALHGILIDWETGDELVHVFGVHLKAFPAETKKRLRQATVIAKAIRDLEHELPVVILGDFNSYFSEKTGKYRDDKVLLDRTFRRYRNGLKRTYLRGKSTYRSGSYQDQFDHIWVDRAFRYQGRAGVSGPCNGASGTSRSRFADLEDYNRNISDHCPLSVTVTFPR